MLAWDTQLPTDAWVVTFLIPEPARPAAIPVVLNTHPEQVTATWLLIQAAFQLHMLYLSPSNNRDRLCCSIVHSRRHYA